METGSTVNGTPDQPIMKSKVNKANHMIRASNVLFISLVIIMSKQPRTISYLRISNMEDKGKHKTNTEGKKIKQEESNLEKTRAYEEGKYFKKKSETKAIQK